MTSYWHCTLRHRMKRILLMKAGQASPVVELFKLQMAQKFQTNCFMPLRWYHSSGGSPRLSMLCGGMGWEGNDQYHGVERLVWILLSLWQEGEESSWPANRMNFEILSAIPLQYKVEYCISGNTGRLWMQVLRTKYTSGGFLSSTVSERKYWKEPSLSRREVSSAFWTERDDNGPLLH